MDRRFLPLHQPRNRGQCPVRRPCRHVWCRFHLLVTVAADGSLQLWSARREVGRPPSLPNRRLPQATVDRFIEKALERLRHMTWTCALDVAERFRAGEISLGGVGQILGCGEDAATKAEERAVEKVIMAFGDRDKAMAGLRALIEEST